MILYPAIDLYAGQAVRLHQGRYDEMTVYSDNPAALALRLKAEGANHLHAVEGLCLELGGGIRSIQNVREYLASGISRVILGTAAVENEALLRAALEEFGDKIAVGLDLKDGFVAVRGWEQQSRWTADAFLHHLTELGVRTVICTDISRDGILAGSNHDLYRDLSLSFPVDLIASGGVSSLDDIRGLREIGMAGAILGRAYYSGWVSIPDALAAAEGNSERKTP